MNKAYLGIDTSMYTTSVAVVDQNGNLLFEQRELLKVDMGKRGLQQSVAVFEHLKALPLILENMGDYSLAAIGVSTKPRNLESSYMPVFTVGESFARAIGKILKIPVYTFSHQENHLGATLYGKDLTIEDPVLFVHLSGGTTEIVLAKPGIGVDFFDMKVLGESMDISAGQLIDRVGVKLGMPFPAGPYMEMESNQMEKKGLINKPNPLKVCEKNGNLFFSGIETKVLKMITSGQYEAAVIARNLEELIAKSLIQSIGHAHNRYPVKTIIIAGGVAANKRIRRILNDGLPAFTLCFPEEKFSGDHGVGVALLAKRVLENSRR